MRAMNLSSFRPDSANARPGSMSAISPVKPVGSSADNPSNTASITVFRPPILLRAVGAVIGVLCAWAAILQTWAGIAHGEPGRLIGALVVVAPCGLALAVLRKTVVVRPEGLQSTTLIGDRQIPWNAVYRIDQTRTSFVIETRHGPVSAGWLAREQRERLLRQVLERARLAAHSGKLRWGLMAQYVPRTQTIALQPSRPAPSQQAPPQENG